MQLSSVPVPVFFQSYGLDPQTLIKVQAEIVSALCTTHSFIKHHDSMEGELPDKNSGHSTFAPNPGDNGVQKIEADVSAEVIAHYDLIIYIWESYQRILEARDG